MEIKATIGLIRPVGQVGQKLRNQRRKAAQHTPNQRRKALHKTPAGGATHHYHGRRKATQSQTTPPRQAAQHTPNQRRQALHKPPSGGATHHYPGRRKATHTPDNSAPPSGAMIVR